MAGYFIDDHRHPITLISHLLGGETGLSCRDISLLWSAVVFGAAFLIALLIWFEASGLHGLRSVFEAP
jgi:hypothetical protein